MPTEASSDARSDWPYDTPVGELPHLPFGIVLGAVVMIFLCGLFGLCVLVSDLT